MIELTQNKGIHSKIYPLFKPHTCYIEPFFSGGSMFFHKPKAEQNVLNDVNDNIFNFFDTIHYKEDALISEIKSTTFDVKVISQYKGFRKNHEYLGNIPKALSFLFFSVFNYAGGSIIHSQDEIKRTLINEIDNIAKNLASGVCYNTKTGCYNRSDFFFRILRRDFMFRPNYNDYDMSEDMFIYVDKNNTCVNFHSEKNYEYLFKELISLGKPFAVLDFDTDMCLKAAKTCDLEVSQIGENKNKPSEILITNYKIYNTLF